VIETTADLFETYRGRLVFRQGIAWPNIYHLRLLAWTRGWRTPENRAVVAESVRRLVRLSPIPAGSVRFKSRLVAPASFCMDDFCPDLAALDSAHWMMWFHRMELLARLGVARCIPELESQAAALMKILASGYGQFTLKLEQTYFRKWGAYTGLALENDWKDPQRRQNDLTFRSLLILDRLCST